MKNIVIVLGLAASFFMFTGCANQSGGASNQGMSAPASAEAAPSHHDFKGEVEGK